MWINILTIFTINVFAGNCLNETTPELRSFMSELYKGERGRGIKSDEASKKFSKLISIMMKESSGNPCAMSDMNGVGSYNSYTSFFRHNNSKGISSRSHKVDFDLCRKTKSQNQVKITKQTNYGLAQISADRFVMENRGAPLIRDFFKQLNSDDLTGLVQSCLSTKFYQEDTSQLKTEFKKLRECKPGISNKEQIKCIGEAVTLCPALNARIALTQPMSYFETRNASSLCIELFKKAETEFMLSEMKRIEDIQKRGLASPQKKCCEDNSP